MRLFFILCIWVLFIPFSAFCQSSDTSKSKKLKEVSVRARRSTGTNAELIKELKTSNGVVSGISSEQIAKSQDRDAAEVIKRIQGVTLNNDRFIVIRGIAERYNETWLNGAGIPSGEADKRAFSFEIIPSTLIDRIVIYKTPSAELPGDFAGGFTQIITKSAPLGSSLTIGLNGYFRNGTTLQTVQFTEGSKTDWLGYDNGFRSIPAGVPNYLEAPSAASTKLFKDTWGLHDKTALPDVRLNITYTKGIKFHNLTAGMVAGLTYDNLTTRYKINSREYDKTLKDSLIASTDNVQSTNIARIGAMLNFKLNFGARTSLELKNFLSQSGQTQSNVQTGSYYDGFVKNFIFGYESKRLLSSQLGFVHHFSDAIAYDISAGWAFNERSNPDLRQIFYAYPPDTFYRSNLPSGSGNIVIDDGATRFYSSLKEHEYSLNQSLKLSPTIGSFKPIVLAGGYTEWKNRSFSSRLFGYFLPSSTLRRSLTGLPPELMFSGYYIDIADTAAGGNNAPAGFRIGETTNPSDSYTGTNTLLAPYVSVQIPISPKLSMVAGARFEHNEQTLNTTVGATPVNIDQKTDYWLPSASIKYLLKENSILRASYGKTLNRPEFRECAPFLYYDFALSALANGSLFPSIDHPQGFILETAKNDNYDLSYDYFPSNSEQIQQVFSTNIFSIL